MIREELLKQIAAELCQKGSLIYAEKLRFEPAIESLARKAFLKKEILDMCFNDFLNETFRPGIYREAKKIAIGMERGTRSQPASTWKAAKE